MELDDLKSIWKKQDAGFSHKGEDEIALMLKGRSKSLISKLKRSVWFELLFTILCALILSYYAINLQTGAVRWTSISLLVLLLAYLIYYVKKIKLLNEYDPAHENLREHLEGIVLRLQTYLNFYRRSYTILYPVYFCLGILFGAIEKGFDAFFTRFQDPKFVFWFIGFALVFTVGVFTLTNWLLNKLYGNHLTKLKELLRDLNS